MDPNIFGNIDNSKFVGNGYYNLQPPTAQNINVNPIPNYNNDSMSYNNNFSLQHTNTNMFSNKTNPQYCSIAPQNVGHVGQQVSLHHIGNTTGNVFGNAPLPFSISQTEFEIPGFKIKIIVEPISHQQDQLPNNPF